MTTALTRAYQERKEAIKSRLNEFKTFYESQVSWFLEEGNIILKPVSRKDNERIFEELCFCLLTANTSALMGMKALDSIREVMHVGSREEIREGLVKSGYRFPNVRADFIAEAREKFRERYSFDIKSIIESFPSAFESRQFFAEEVRGLGYKEASHFLRNIGFSGLAILDKHILRSLHEYKVIKEIPKNMNKKIYLDIEKKFIGFCNINQIPVDEMDLLLWSMKTGKIMK